MADSDTASGTTDNGTTDKLKEAQDHAAKAAENVKAAASAGADAAAEATAEAKARFGKAIDEARAGAVALGQEALNRGDLYRTQLTEKSGDLAEDAKARASQLANDGKARASDALGGLGKYVSENASLVDEKLGNRAGDFARSAAVAIQDVAGALEAKDYAELGEDVKAFVRANPVAALGFAAMAGYTLARLFRSRPRPGADA